MMTKSELDAFVQRSERVYESRLKTSLEHDHVDEFVAIEPDSGDYFLGKTLSEAMEAAHRVHPSRRVHAMRVGHAAALHFGVHLQ